MRVSPPNQPRLPRCRASDLFYQLPRNKPLLAVSGYCLSTAKAWASEQLQKGCRLMCFPDNVSEYIFDSGSLESGCTSHFPPFLQTFHPPQILLCLCECSLFPGFPRGKNTNAIRFSLPNNRSATFYGPKTEAICQALGRALAKEPRCGMSPGGGDEETRL